MASPDPIRQSTSAVRLANARAVPIKLQLEPWGETFEMPAGAVFEIVANGPSDGELQVELGDAEILVCGWPGSIVGVIHEADELGDRDRPRVPLLTLDEIKAPVPRARYASRYSGDGQD